MTVPVWVRGTLLLTVTLVAGVVIGVGYERYRMPGHQVSRLDNHHMMRSFERDLALDSAQLGAIAAILARHQGAVDSTWHAVRPHVRAALDLTQQEIAGVLRPDQLAKYRKMTQGTHSAPPR